MLKQIALGLFFVAAVTIGHINAEDSIELGDSDFDSTLGTYETALVMFYAPW